MKFTLVSTVFNEASRVRQTIADIEGQTVLPDEIIIVDAGSGDGTIGILQEWASESSINIVVIVDPGCNVAKGRNQAIASATSEYIISTDFGCRFHPNWFESLSIPFKKDGSVLVVGGSYSVIEEEIQSLAARANYLLSDGYYVKPYSGFIPSSRSIAYHKSVWETVDGYPEWLTLAADDLVYGMKVLKAGYSIYYVDQPYVYWSRFENAKTYGKEAFRYGLGDGEAHVNRRQFYSKVLESVLRYTLLPVLAVMIVLIGAGLIPTYILGVILFFLPGFRSYWFAFKMYRKYKSRKYTLEVFFMSLYLIELTRINYICGYWKGWFKSSAEQKKQAEKLNRFLLDYSS